MKRKRSCLKRDVKPKSKEAPDENVTPSCAHIYVGHWDMVFDPKHLVSEPLVGLVLLKELCEDRER